MNTEILDDISNCSYFTFEVNFDFRNETINLEPCIFLRGVSIQLKSYANKKSDTVSN